MIAGLWGISFFLEAAIKTYDPPAAIHGLMMVVVTAAFGSQFVQRKEEQ